MVFSVCNIGLGKMKRGEGFMSLFYVFVLVGVFVIVMSFWKILD